MTMINKNIKYVLSTSLILIISIKVFSQSYIPINVKGFNHDIIAEGSGGMDRADSTTTTTFDDVSDNGDNVLYSKDFRGNKNVTSPPPFGLPNDGIINSKNLVGAVYQLAPYDQKNALVLKTQNESGTLTLETPGVFSKIAFLAASANGVSQFDMVLNFSDGTKFTNIFSVRDWFSGTPFAADSIGRIHRTNFGTHLADEFSHSGDNPRLYDDQLIIAAPFDTKILTSISITKTSSGGRTAIFSIIGITPVNAPTAPIATAATNISAPNFTANWQAVANATTYYIDISRNPNFTNIVSAYNNRNVGNVQTLSISGLPNYPIYYYRVRAGNAAGISASSNSVNVILQQCPSGNVIINKQIDLDSFKIKYPYCTKITGLLNVTASSDIVNVDGFSNIDTITGQLNITSNTKLTNLEGFRKLKLVGSNFWISGNSILKSITSFDSLASTGIFNIGPNTILDTISGFQKIQNIGALQIVDNPELKNFSCFDAITSTNNAITFRNNPKLVDIQSIGKINSIAGALTIDNNTSLTNLTAFKSIKLIKEISILTNPAIKNLNDLSSVANVNGKIQIENNNILNDITGLSNINPASIKAEGIVINTNPALSLCNLPNFCTYLQGGGARSISGNLGDCLTDQAIITACNRLLAPNALPVTNVSATGFTANWQTVSGATSYEIDVSLNAAFTSFVGTYNSLSVGNVLSYNITGLTNSTTFYFRLRANNSFGTSPNSNVITVTTLNVAPAAPTSLVATNITATSFTANWQAVNNATSYSIDVSLNPAFSTYVGTYNNLSVGNVQTLNITGLTANTTYYYRIRANNAVGSSPNSNVITVTTSNVAPAAPTALAATNITATSFTANWQVVNNANGYYIDVSQNAAFSTFVSNFNNASVGNVQTLNITGLTLNTTYYYRIRASNAVGTSPNSNAIQVTLPDNSIGPKPISVSGFNYDIIANGSGGTNRAIASTTNDLGTYVLYSKDFRGNNNQSTAPKYGLPDNGKITNASLTGYDYQLANYDGNNALVLKNSNDTGTLRLNVQDTFTNISFLAFSENGASAVTAVASFSDGTNTTMDFTVLDWFDQPNFAIKGIGRMKRSDDVFASDESDENPRLYNHEFALSAPFDTKRLVSLTITKTSTGGGLAVLAITGLSHGKNQSCNITIPDANFKSYLLSNSAINTNGDGEIQCVEADAFNGFIDCSLKDISDLTGIEKFINITKLDCSNNNLTKLDLSKNTRLNVILCGVNQLSSLNVTSCTALKELYCGATNLPALDVSNNTDLTILQCYNAFIAKLDLSKNIKLERLECNDDELLSLDISKNTSLLELNCNGNTLRSLNLANGINEDMTFIEALYNPDLTCIKVDNEDFSNNNWRKAPFQFDTQHVFKIECEACDAWRDKLNSNFLTSASACVGDNIHLIDYSYLEENQDAKFLWDFGNGKTSTKRDPILVYEQVGTYTVSLTVNDTICKSFVVQKDISILSCLNTGSDPLNSGILYPTPNRGDVKLKLNLQESSPVLIRVYNSGGNIIKELNLDEARFFIENVHLDYPGIYFIEIIHNFGIIKLKTMVVK